MTVQPPEDLKEKLAQAGVDPTDPNVLVAVQITRSYSGPLPSPLLLAEYERVVPGLAAQIVRWTTDETKHRRERERLVDRGDERRASRGQLIAAAVAVLGLLGATAVMVFGDAYAGMVLAVVGVGGPTAATILARVLGRGRNGDD